MDKKIEEIKKWLKANLEHFRWDDDVFDYVEYSIAEIERLENALEFYATSENWKNNVVDIGVGSLPEPESSEVACDHGYIAKQALKELKK